METKISKGSAVRAVPSEKYKSNVTGYVVLSDADIENWRSSSASRGMTDAGETKLPPKSRAIVLDPEKTYVVLRARATVKVGYGNPMGGMTLVLDATTGDEIYVRRNDLRVVG